jgi:hypothetical protein
MDKTNPFAAVVVAALTLMLAGALYVNCQGCQGPDQSEISWPAVAREVLATEADLIDARASFPEHAKTIDPVLEALAVARRALQEIEAGQPSGAAARIALDTALLSLDGVEEPWAFAARVVLRRVRENLNWAPIGLEIGGPPVPIPFGGLIMFDLSWQSKGPGGSTVTYWKGGNCYGAWNYVVPPVWWGGIPPVPPDPDCNSVRALLSRRLFTLTLEDLDTLMQEHPATPHVKAAGERVLRFLQHPMVAVRPPIVEALQEVLADLERAHQALQTPAEPAPVRDPVTGRYESASEGEPVPTRDPATGQYEAQTEDYPGPR